MVTQTVKSFEPRAYFWTMAPLPQMLRGLDHSLSLIKLVDLAEVEQENNMIVFSSSITGSILTVFSFTKIQLRQGSFHHHS